MVASLVDEVASVDDSFSIASKKKKKLKTYCISKIYIKNVFIISLSEKTLPPSQMNLLLVLQFLSSQPPWWLNRTQESPVFYRKINVYLLTKQVNALSFA